uniref:Nuclear receptor domain-containing protein n=1 Tax=Heterorhabditis bacteriophora TaxID=37862 RepID=A0A1I7WSD8_HETBA
MRFAIWRQPEEALNGDVDDEEDVICNDEAFSKYIISQVDRMLNYYMYFQRKLFIFCNYFVLVILIIEGTTLSTHELVSMILQVAKALVHLHSLGVIHKDVATRYQVIFSCWYERVNERPSSEQVVSALQEFTQHRMLPVQWCIKPDASRLCCGGIPPFSKYSQHRNSLVAYLIRSKVRSSTLFVTVTYATFISIRSHCQGNEQTRLLVVEERKGRLTKLLIYKFPYYVYFHFNYPINLLYYCFKFVLSFRLQIIQICRVCGDKAFSYNFNVITCESCKAFFRRNANKVLLLIKYEDSYVIYLFTTFINSSHKILLQSSSRLQFAKCTFLVIYRFVGMKKEWIMSDEARLEKKQRVEENRERRLQDALARASESQEMEIGTHRERVKSESKPDEQLPVTARDFIVVPEEKCSMIMTAEVSSVISSPLCPSQQLIDSVPTTDPTTTMSSSGFIPPTVPDSVTNAVESSLMAQAQLAAAQVQVQAAINHQQQQVRFRKSIILLITFALLLMTTHTDSCSSCSPTSSCSYCECSTSSTNSSSNHSTFINTGSFLSCLFFILAISKIVFIYKSSRHRRDERYQYKRSVVSLANEGIRLLIRMCKRLPSFRSLNNHDQVILIKHACIPYVIIREAMSYDPSENMWCGISIESGLSTRMDSLTDSQEDMKKHSIRYSVFIYLIIQIYSNVGFIQYLIIFLSYHIDFNVLKVPR